MNNKAKELDLILQKLKDNPRVEKIRIIVSDGCCPACAAWDGKYNKEDVPSLPVEGCSSPNGCRCFYEPLLNTIYP